MKTEEIYIKLKIEGIFDLHTLAEEYEMSPKEIVDFHNQYCTLKEMLTLNFPKYVEYVYLPSKKHKKRQDKKLRQSVLNLPENNGEKLYGVVLKYHPKDLQIHYQIKIKRHFDYIEIYKEKTYVNHLEIDQAIEQLFEKAERALYPLQLLLEKKGGLNKILNSKEIKERWEQNIEPELRAYYQSETGDEIINKLGLVFADINKKRDLLERNLFYKLFFLPVYQTYLSFSEEDFLQVYFAGLSREIKYRIKYDLQKEFTRNDKIALKISGIEEENIFNENIKKGKIDLIYKFNKTTSEIFSITGKITAFDNNMGLETDFQLYELKNSQ